MQKFQRDWASLLTDIGTPVFLAGINPSGSRLTLHVRSGCDAAKLKSQTQLVLERVGEPVRVSVRIHNLRKLAHPRSLEHWLKRFDSDQSVYDPTMILSRARGLLLAAKSCRSALGNVIGGLFFDPERRTLFVLNRRNSDVAANSALRQQVGTILRASWDRAWINVQVVSDLPRRKMIPVDAKSASLARRFMRAIRRWLAPIAVALAVTGAALPAAASYDAEQVGRQAISTQAAPSEFGVLSGLSVFADGQRQDGQDLFASASLRMYFGDFSYSGTDEVVRYAQLVQPRQKKRRLRDQDPDITGEINNPDVTGQVGPGS